MHAKSFSCLLAIALGLAHPRYAGAEDECKGPANDCVAVGRWNFSVALGAGAMTNPLVNGKDIPLIVVPQFSYYGKRFFIDDLDAGFTVAQTGGSTFNLVASPGYDRVFFYRSDLQNLFVSGFPSVPALVGAGTPGAVAVPPRPRRITYLAGPEWTLKYGGVIGQVDVLHEITGQNAGNEVRAAVALPLMQARGALTATIGLTWKSAAIVNYYYGVGNIYEANSALDPFVKLGYTLPLTANWRFSTFAEYERLGSAIADSPIVAERYVATAFVGAIYIF